MLLKILQTGEPVLRRNARALTREEVQGPAVQQLIRLMRDTMRDAPGVGLAGPQVGLDLQLAVIEDPGEHRTTSRRSGWPNASANRYPSTSLSTR